jgi:hypothetical protein
MRGIRVFFCLLTCAPCARCAATDASKSTSSARLPTPELPSVEPKDTRAPPPRETLTREAEKERDAIESEAATPEGRLRFWHALFEGPRHHPPQLDGAPRNSRMKPGNYRCRVGREYKLRDCVVEKAANGQLMLEAMSGNLLGFRGVLWDEGQSVHFEGWLTDEQPFGCSSCQDRCIAEPGSCACEPLPAEAVRECIAQPVQIVFHGATEYVGMLTHGLYFNQYSGDGEQRHPSGYEVKPERLEVRLVPATAPGSGPATSRPDNQNLGSAPR